VSVVPWFGQPEHPVGTAILLPGRSFGVSTPLLHWSAELLTEHGWSVLAVSYDFDEVARDARAHVLRCAGAALERAVDDRPVMVVAKSLGTLALPWAVQNGLPGAWLTPLLQDAPAVTAAHEARQPTLLVGGTADPHWQPPLSAGPAVSLMELAGADHGLQRPGEWRRSLLDQVAIFDRVRELAEHVLARKTMSEAAAPDGGR